MTRPSVIASLFAVLLMALPRAPRALPVARSASDGFVTYRLLGGDLYRLDARAGAQPVDVSEALARLSGGGADEWLNTTPNGAWLLTSTERFGCGGWACLARVSGSLASGAALHTPAGVIHADGFGAISSDGRTVVFGAGGGAHTRDLWVSRLGSGGWTTPTAITGSSRYRYNTQPAISADGRRVLFDCGPGPAEEPGTAFCEVPVDGGRASVVMAPTGGPGGSLRHEVHHPDFAPNGDLVFEADWRGEQVWRLPRGSRTPVLVSRVHNDNSPCVLPDGRIASLYLDRPGNARGLHEIRVADANGSHGREILTGRDVLDIGIGCG
jgi:hypothetical protein